MIFSTVPGTQDSTFKEFRVWVKKNEVRYIGEESFICTIGKVTYILKQFPPHLIEDVNGDIIDEDGNTYSWDISSVELENPYFDATKEDF